MNAEIFDALETGQAIFHFLFQTKKEKGERALV